MTISTSPFFRSSDRLFLLCRRCPETAQKINAHRKVLHALYERIVMLLCQNGGRNQVDHLFALLYCLKRCTDRNLRLAVSDITADQAVHDLLALHVLLCRLDRRKLIVRLLKRKHLLKFLLPDRILSVRIAVFRLPLAYSFTRSCDIFYRMANPAFWSYSIPDRRAYSASAPLQLRRTHTSAAIELGGQHIEVLPPAYSIFM